MKSKKRFWAFVGTGVLLVGLLTSCSSPRSLAVNSPLETPGVEGVTHTSDEVVLASDLGWGYPSTTPLPYQQVGLGEPRQVILTMQDEEPIVALIPIGITGDLLIANVRFTPSPRTAEEVPWVIEHARGGLVAVDLVTGQVRMLREDVGGHATDGRYVVWKVQQTTADDQHISELHIYDLQGSQEFVVEDVSPNRPDISNSVVVWYEPRDGGWGIYGYDISREKLFTVSGGEGTRMFPHISGYWVVYLDLQREREATLHVHNIETGEDFTLGITPYSNNAFAGRFHAIGPGRVAWVENETYQVHLYDLNTNQDRVLTELPADCRFNDPMLSENFLLIGGCGQLMGYDLSRDVLFSVPLLPPGDWESMLGSSGVVLSGDRVAWNLTLNGELRLYTAQIVRE